MVNIKYIWLVSPNKTFKVRRHVHNCYELIYYFSATGHASYNAENKTNAKPDSQIDYLDDSFDLNLNNTFYFEDNTLLLIPPKVVHDEVQEKYPKIIDVGFEFEDDDLNLGPTLFRDKHLELLPFFKRIEEEMINKDGYYQQCIKSLVDQIIIFLTRQSNKEIKKTDPITFAVNYLDEYYSTDININDIAKQTGYTPEHFRFLFNQRVGMSPKEYVMKKRINNACNLLKETKYKVSDIASFSGYDDVSQFSVVFKKWTGMSPLVYRKNGK